MASNCSSFVEPLKTVLPQASRIVNDAAQRVAVVLDRAMLEQDPLNYHPLDNTRTTAIAAADLLRFIAGCGHAPRILDLDAVGSASGPG